MAQYLPCAFCSVLGKQDDFEERHIPKPNSWCCRYGKAEGRTSPVMIGSVKSNMGHCEGNSVLASLTKLSLSIENGMLPG